MIFIFFTIIIVSSLSSVISEYTSVIHTNTGPVQGQILTTSRKSMRYASFVGIPFAEPPVGHLRFKPPVKKKNWIETFKATKQGNICVQPSAYGSSELVGSEDCLFINIYTPHVDFDDSSENDLKAVMVWIYGGGFIYGHALDDKLRPDFLLEDDVIVVSFNYRLGPLGFLNLNHVNATGNAGLKDQNLALKWIHDNIIKFGGNPNKVTIFGQSAGAVSVNLHVLSDMSFGLFHQTISISGSPLCLYWGIQTNEEAKLQAFTLGSKLGVETNSKDKLLQALHEFSATDIISKSIEMPFMPFRATVEKNSNQRKKDKFLSECPIKQYLSGKYNKGPYMIGFTSNEAKSFFADSDRNPGDLVEAGLQTLDYGAIQLDIPIFRKYMESLSGASANLTNREYNELIEIATDLFFVAGIDSMQRFVSIHNKYPVYYYRFSFEAAKYLQLFSGNNNITGVGHSEDLLYVFYRPGGGVSIEKPEIESMINRYVRLMTNFAKYGDPTPLGEKDNLLKTKWPNSGMLGWHLEIDKNLTVGPRPINFRVTMFELAGTATSPLLNDCISFENCDKVE